MSFLYIVPLGDYGPYDSQMLIKQIRCLTSSCEHNEVRTADTLTFYQ